MIERFYLKENLSFSEVDLEFKNGLVVFSGASGSGKSVLFDAILSIFGLSNPKSLMSELCLDTTLDLSEFGIETVDDLTIFKQIKKEKNRYFINNQFVSKNVITSISKKFIKFLNLKDFSDFSNDKLLELIDNIIISYDEKFKNLINEYKENFNNFYKLKQELSQIISQEKMATEQCEFLSFEIEKIENINPQVGEYEELLKIKKQLSKKEKIANLLSTANEIFNYESVVHKTLDELEINSDFFNETMINLKSCFEDINSQFEELESINIEEILSRLSILSDLNRKYGSIENILIVKDNKRIELEKYQNISFEKDKIVLEIEKISQTLEKFANQITTKRVKAIKKLSKTINEYAQMLYLSEVNLSIVNKELSKSGQDEVTIFLDNTTLKSISSGEFNRLRLALICANNELSSTKNNGILILDEIDSNLSGKESQSVANVLNILSKNYQILSISHQPQLTSVANQHFIVEKDSNKSIVRELNFEQRVDEIARMISSDKVTVQAKDLAKELLNS